jgi:DNA repair exonuclease SbcCD nuclease subunit
MGRDKTYDWRRNKTLKFLYMTDTHFRSERPVHRIDDVYKTQFEELGEISNLVLEHDLDFIVHGGDVFHTNRPSHELVRDLIGWAKYTNVPIYVVPGNHDLQGYNPNSISSVGLGVLFESELFHQLDEKVFEEEKVYFKGVLPEVEPEGNISYMVDPMWDEYTRIIVSHNYVIPEDSMMFSFIHPEKVATNAQLILMGHYHKPFDYTMAKARVTDNTSIGLPVKSTYFDEQKYGKARFINPGALSRWEIDSKDRIPTVLLIEIENGKIDVKYIPLTCAKKAEEIFDLTKVENEKAKEDQLKSFMDSLQNTSFETNDIEQLVLSAGKNQGIEERILNKSLEMIRNAKEVLK